MSRASRWALAGARPTVSRAAGLSSLSSRRKKLPTPPILLRTCSSLRSVDCRIRSCRKAIKQTYVFYYKCGTSSLCANVSRYMRQGPYLVPSEGLNARLSLLSGCRPFFARRSLFFPSSFLVHQVHSTLGTGQFRKSVSKKCVNDGMIHFIVGTIRHYRVYTIFSFFNYLLSVASFTPMQNMLE